jgi:hypothetical protein
MAEIIRQQCFEGAGGLAGLSLAGTTADNTVQ